MQVVRYYTTIIFLSLARSRACSDRIWFCRGRSVRPGSTHLHTVPDRSAYGVDVLGMVQIPPPVCFLSSRWQRFRLCLRRTGPALLRRSQAPISARRRRRTLPSDHSHVHCVHLRIIEDSFARGEYFRRQSRRPCITREWDGGSEEVWSQMNMQLLPQPTKEFNDAKRRLHGAVRLCPGHELVSQNRRSMPFTGRGPAPSCWLSKRTRRSRM